MSEVQKKFVVKMSTPRKDCLNLKKELKQYLAKKDVEIRKKLKDGPPSLDDPIPEPPTKSFVFETSFFMF